MTRGARAAAAVALFVFAGATAPGPAAATVGPGGPAAPITRTQGVPCVGADELARLLGGSLFWRADTRKLVVRAQGHRITFTVDVPVVLLDDHVLRLDAPVRSVGGQLQVPVALVPLLPRDSSAVRLVVDLAAGRVRATPPEGYVAPPRVSLAAGSTRVTLLSARAAAARVTGRGRGHFRVWLPGAPGTGLPDSLPAAGLVRALRRLPGGDGVTWEMTVAAAASGWRLTVSPAQDAAVLEFSTGGEGDLESFAWEGPSGPRPLRVVVLDPGHGGADAGVSATGAVEKDLALSLAHALGDELARRTGARVVLTREGDQALGQSERAEIANRARADLVLSLHFDGVPGTRARGATAYVPPAADPDAAGASGAGALVRWRDVAMRRAVESRSLGDALAAALESRGYGPARVREKLPVALLGVNAPGAALECATLTAPEDLARVTAPDGLRGLAAAIADGVIAWARHE